MSLIDNLNTIKSCKEDIKTALENKGVDMTGVSFPDYASKIDEIQGGEVVGYTLRDYVEGITITDLSDASITKVRNNAFYQNRELRTVNLPACSIINDNAFNGCEQLSSVSLPSCEYIGQQVFYYCNTLTSIDLPKCKRFEYYAFAQCYSLQSISLPVCSYIGYYALTGAAIQSIDLPAAENTDGYAFDGCGSLHTVNAPVLSRVADYCFNNCGNLQSISIPKLERIEYGGFQNCASLQSIDLPSCKYIGDYVFQNCSSLQSVSIPICNEIRDGAFDGCAISEISLPKLNAIGAQPFINCSSLSTIYLNINNLLPVHNFELVVGTPLAEGIGSIYVAPDMYSRYVTAEGWSSVSQIFVSYGNNVVPDLSVADGVLVGTASTLNNFTFDFLGIDRGPLTGVSLPSCKNIETNVFQNCGSLQSISLPVCSYIGDWAFVDDGSLSVVTIGTELDYVCTMGGDAFINCFALQSIYVPASLVDAYKTANNWSNYADKIVPFS